MSGMEVIVGLERLTIHQCESLAKDLPEGATFDLCGPKGKKPCRWLDPYMGLFIIGDDKGFVMTRDFEFLKDIWCENLMPPAASQGEKK